jgi:hypothetical protein
MKRAVVWVLILLFAFSASYAEEQTAQEPDIKNPKEQDDTPAAVNAITNQPVSKTAFKASFIYYMPDDDDDWDKGYGAEAQLQAWQTDNLGFAFSVGMANWELTEYTYSGMLYGAYVAEKISGDATLTPIGVSILLRPKLEGGMKLTLETGIRYLLVDVNADYSAVVTGPGGTYVEDASYEADDAIVGVVQADLEFPVSKSAAFFGGVGLQFDISKSEASIWAYGQKTSGDVSAQALMFRLGFVNYF